MVHTFPEGFIPIGDAFAQAREATEDCAPLLRQIDKAKTDDERFGLFDRYDALSRRVERQMRNALADGHLQAFTRGQNGQIEQIVDREEFRRESFGVPGIENVPHHLTNPGPDTDGQPIFLKISEFDDWLPTRPKIRPALPLNQPKKMSELDRDLYPEMSALLKRGDATSVTQAARQVADRAKTRGGTLESVTKRLARGYQKHRRS